MRDLAPELARRRAAGLYRERLTSDGPCAPEMRVDGATLLAFCSNDYLGLANHPRVVEAMRSAARASGVGAGASHLVSGHGRAHAALERDIAEFTGQPAALVFSTGYMANQGAVGALVGRGDRVFEDRLNHASLIDAARVSGARLHRYRHCDVAALRRLLGRADGGERLVATDGVFSMDGDIAPLAGLKAAAAAASAWLLVDDAHGLGVLGARGRGSFEHQGVACDGPCVLMGTLGKAFGTFGAFVAGPVDLVDTLVQQARTYIYTTAMPPALAEASRAALAVAAQEDWRRTHLRELVERFRTGIAGLDATLAASPTPIQPLLVGSPERALAASAALRARGLLVTAIRPPTVPAGSARLRITFSAAHSLAQVDRLVEALHQIAPLLGPDGGSA